MVELNRVMEFAIRTHAGQKRMTGEDYITHPIAVAEILKQKGYNEDYQAVALCHDIIEDVPSAALELISVLEGTGKLYHSVLSLTKTGKSMESYLANIKADAIAYPVKLADRYHNITTARGCNHFFIEKYIKETEKYYLDFAKGSNFEEDIKRALYELKAETYGEWGAKRPYKEFEKIFVFEIAEPDTNKDVEELEDRLCFSIVWNSLHNVSQISPNDEDDEFIVTKDVYDYLKGLKSNGVIMHYKLVGYLGMSYDSYGNVIE